MMKKLFLLCLLGCSYAGYSQHVTTPTDSITISGKISKQVVFTIKDFIRFKTVRLPDFTITNHLGEVKRTVKGLKGFPAKLLLDSLRFTTEGPKQLSEFYFTFTAIDGYKVVFSWNEIFNNPTGNNLYVLTEKEGENLSTMKDRIVMMCTSDFKTGRRYIEGLRSITVNRVE